MDKQTLVAQKRKITGRKVKTLRREGVLPGNIYGKKVKSLAVSVKESDFDKVYKVAGETGLLEIKVDGEARPVLIHNLQKNPVTDALIHVDFLQVDLKEKVTAQVPLELSGESPAEKQGLGTVVQYVNEVEVEALPSDLPEKFQIDKSQLTEVDQAVKISDLSVARGKVEIKADPELIVVKVEPPQKEEEVAPAPAPEGEVPAEGEAPAVPAEGEEQPKEGAETPVEEKPQA
jgi:large subunit ribosomal protein L25